MDLPLMIPKTYELVTVHYVFEGRFNSDTILIRQFQELLGATPDHWLRDTISSGLLEKPPYCVSSIPQSS